MRKLHKQKEAHAYIHTLWRLSVSQGSPHNYSSVPAGFPSPECKRLVNLKDLRLMCLWLQVKLICARSLHLPLDLTLHSKSSTFQDPTSSTLQLLRS